MDPPLAAIMLLASVADMVKARALEPRTSSRASPMVDVEERMEALNVPPRAAVRSPPSALSVYPMRV
jgi:hypothetical protein